MVVSPLSFALQRAILHALSCSVMGVPSGEDSLCGDVRFQAFLASALAQRRGNVLEGGGEGAKLRSKAAFVLKVIFFLLTEKCTISLVEQFFFISTGYPKFYSTIKRDQKLGCVV